MNVTTEQLFTTIGILKVENDELRRQNKALQDRVAELVAQGPASAEKRASREK